MRSYKVELSRRAADTVCEMARRQPELYRRIGNALDALAENPFEGKALKGELKDLYSRRVGTFRIIYRIRKDRLLVLVIDISHRRDVYR